MGEENGAKRMEEEEGVGVKMSRVEEVSDEERSADGNLEEKENREKGVGLEGSRFGSEEEGEVNGTLEDEEVDQGVQNSLETELS